MSTYLLICSLRPRGSSISTPTARKQNRVPLPASLRCPRKQKPQENQSAPPMHANKNQFLKKTDLHLQLPPNAVPLVTAGARSLLFPSSMTTPYAHPQRRFASAAASARPLLFSPPPPDAAVAQLLLRCSPSRDSRRAATSSAVSRSRRRPTARPPSPRAQPRFLIRLLTALSNKHRSSLSIISRV